MVSGSDGYIDLHAKVEPLYEELDHNSEPPAGHYDVPSPPYLFMGSITPSANPVQQPPDVLPPPCANIGCITGSANPVQQPHYENGNA
jgi:hypothetical protein